MVAVLLIVLRPSPEEEEQAETDTGLPREFVPARIVRRVAATVVDVGLALIVASVVLGWVSGLDAGTAGSEYGWILLLMTLVIGWMLGLLSEGLLGRTPGKVLAGCWVAIVGSDGQGKGLSAPNDAQGPRAPGEREGASGTSDHGIGLGRAAVRNTLKWLIPFGLATALGPGGRHLGDVAAGTIVVERRSGDTEKG
jgi:uncharacterized RDD family membrane protein YckC